MSNHEIHVRTIDAGAPLRWLRKGLTDMSATPAASLLHGLLVALGGWVVTWLALRVWQLLPGAFSGFLLVGPILATGLYELSRRREAGQQPGLPQAIDAWRRGTRALVALGLVLFAAGTAWVAFSALLFKLFVHVPITKPVDLLRYAVAEQGELLFWLWMIAGGLGAALVFALTAVSAPLLLDRQVGVRQAMLASVRAVGDNPLPMAIWAVIIMLATAASMATAMLGFVVFVPLIGHATWHAYRETIDARAVPARDPVTSADAR